jgi:hypothetical protein
LSSFDTLTYDLVTDPLLGFLPPNVTAPEGEGFIGYTARPQATLAHGDIIEGAASIKFDDNAASSPIPM